MDIKKFKRWVLITISIKKIVFYPKNLNLIYQSPLSWLKSRQADDELVNKSFLIFFYE